MNHVLYTASVDKGPWRGKFLFDGCRPLQHLKVSHSRWLNVPAALSCNCCPFCATIEWTDTSWGRGGHCEIHPHTERSLGKSIRFNVGLAGGWYVFSRITERLSEVRERCEKVWSSSSQWSVMTYVHMETKILLPFIKTAIAVHSNTMVLWWRPIVPKEPKTWRVPF